MKELSIEEKAKRYDEAIKKVNDYYEGKTKLYSDVDKTLDYLFPEFKELEDERIRKELITHCRNTRCVTEEGAERIAKWIAWLEKRGEKSTLPKWKYKKDNTPLLRDSLILNKYGCVAKSPSGALVDDVWVLDYDELTKLPKEEIEKQSESDETKAKMFLINKGYPIDANGKFPTYEELYGIIKEGLEKQGQELEKVSIWKHWKDGIAGNEGEKLIYLVKKDNTYRLTSCLAFECDYIELSELDSLMLKKQSGQKPVVKYKVGDTIYYNSFGRLVSFVIANIVEDGTDNPMYEDKDGNSVFQNDIVQQNPVAKVEPKFKVGDIIKYIGEREEFSKEKHTIKQILDDCYLTINGTYIPFKFEDCYILVNKNQYWSEEDDQYLLVCKNALAKYQVSDKWDATIISQWLENKLKFLKDRYTWKPSDEQLKSLQEVIDVGYFTSYPNSLETLYEQLKKLKGE